nr:dual oxidase isoform X2 [Parasteatoda tepidariorum]
MKLLMLIAKDRNLCLSIEPSTTPRLDNHPTIHESSTSEAWVNSMRNFVNGTFRMGPSGFPPRNHERAPLHSYPPSDHLRLLSPERMFLLGDPRVHQNPALLSLGILFYRWHNVIATKIVTEHPDWSDEEVFQKARRWVIATLQNVIFYEYLPVLLMENVTAYKGYQADLHPGVSHVFQSAAFRFGHTLIPPGIYKRNAECEFRKTLSGYPAKRLCSTWWDPDKVEDGIEEIIMGMASQIAEKEDNVICSDVRDRLFGSLEFSRRDLAALNVMRGRDNGLPDYNTVRKHFRFPGLSNWSDINPQLMETNPQILEDIKTLYKNFDEIDLYIGGMLETEAGRPGPLFRTIIRQQFERIRDADRFWFENPGVFTKDEVEQIKKVTLKDIVISTTDIPEGSIQNSLFIWSEGDPCPQPMQLTGDALEPCLMLHGHDSFHGNEVAYIYSCLILVFIPIACAGAGYGVIKLQNSRKRRIKLQQEVIVGKHCENLEVKEWLHHNHKRCVKVKIGTDNSLSTLNRKGEVLRKIFLEHPLHFEITEETRKPMLLVRSSKDHDMVLQFRNRGVMSKFLEKLEKDRNGQIQLTPVKRELMLSNAETKEKRQKKLEHFFREAYTLTFGLRPGEKRYLEECNDVVMVMRTSLTRKEFSEALGMRSDALFVKRMFNCIDKDKNGQISFQEFLDTVLLFSRGKTEDKLRIVFDMCDDDGNGVIDKQELSDMLRSLVDIAKTESLGQEDVQGLIEGMFSSSRLQHKEELNYDDFKFMMSEFRGDFIAIGLDCKGAKQNFLDTSTNVARMTSFQYPPFSKPGYWTGQYNSMVTFLEKYRQHVFYLFIFYVITFVLLLERILYYMYLAEHTDLRHVMGVGIAITRGSAAALSFCYSVLLLTMCRNLLTRLRELPLHQYIPLDSHVQFHKVVAATGLFFTLIHTVGHCINFYHVSTQNTDNLRCLTQEINFESDFKPTICYWLFQTVTGATGMLLYVVICIIFTFAHSSIREKAYKYFWLTHSLYVVLYILLLIHGLAKITGSPRFWMFFVGPAILFALDKVVSLQTRYMELDILETELLPSDVTKVKFSRPPNFKYLSGQWVRLSFTAFQPSESHSLTLTSAPHENYLSVHVKAQGPWTWKLRNFFDPSADIRPKPGQKVRLEGPFGGGNQDWYKFEVAIMVGGGIGVTPYASILNDLVFGTSTNRYSGVACKKVYFLWVCPSHRDFEWFIDVLRDVERKDVTKVLEVHIFVTQFFHKFDLRTTMLYICENHFQRISNRRSIFTGLKAVNHFGRPDMSSFLKFVQHQHSYVSKVGVFSCGPSALTNSVSAACQSVNNHRRLPYFLHHFENF